MKLRTAVAAAVVAAAGSVLVLAEPVAADPAVPTDYRSEVTAVDPPTDAFEIEVVGGDSFLRLQAEPGHEVIVFGYTAEDPEPYLRFSPDGTVSRNLRSEATYINDDRYGSATVPEGLSPADEPEWEVIDDDGEYAWHDHRIHWMSPDRPPGREPGDVVFDEWRVPVAVDGEPVVVTGMLRWVEGIDSVRWFGLAAVVAVLVVVAARRRAVLVAGAALVVAGAAAIVVAVAEQAAIPDGAGGSPVPVVLAALAAVAALATVLLRHRPAAAITALAAVALLSSWALWRISVLLKPVLPTDLAPWADRAGTAVALGVAVAAAVAVVRSGALRLPDLADDDEGSAVS